MYVSAPTPESEKFALALPLVTAAGPAVPIVVAPFLTVKDTVPTLGAGPLAGVTVAVSATEESPNVAVLLCAKVVVLTEPDVTTRVAVPDVGPGPWQPAPLFVPVTEIGNEPVGVEPVVEMLRLVTTFAPVVVTGFVPKVAVAPAGRPPAAKVTVHALLFPPTVSVTV